MVTATPISEWRAGRGLLLAAFLGCAISGLPAYSLGPVMVPLEDAFGWSRATISAGVLISTVCAMLLFPVVGMVIDRIGARRVALFGCVAAGVSLGGIGLSGGAEWTWYLSWTIFAVLTVAATPLVWMAAVASRFTAARGMALAIVGSGSAFGGMVVPGVTLWIVAEHGWRWVYFTFAAFPILVVLPVAWLLFRDANDIGRQSTDAALPVAAATPPGATLSEAIATPTFWKLSVFLVLLGYCAGQLTVHYIPMLAHSGLAAPMLGLAAGVFGPAALAGRLATGFLLDRGVPPHLLGSATALLPIAAALLLLNGEQSAATASLIAILAGYPVGAILIFPPYVAGRSFGMRSFGKINGLLIGAYSIGFGVGPVAAGLMFDANDDYRAVQTIILAVALAASAAMASMRRLPSPAVA